MARLRQAGAATPRLFIKSGGTMTATVRATWLAFLLLALTSKMMLAFASNVTTVGETDEDGFPIGIVIMAQGRSGSTMLGETFRQNKEVMYWFEPCRAWGEGLFDSSHVYHREMLGQECAELVVRLALCEFTAEDSARLGVDASALEMGSPQLWPLRGAAAIPSADVISRAHDVVMRGCQQSRAVVIKTIRADAGVSGVLNVDDNPHNHDSKKSDIYIKKLSKLRVIHLVRDPRAVIHSQINTFNVAHKYRRYFSPAENATAENRVSLTRVSQNSTERSPESFSEDSPERSAQRIAERTALRRHAADGETGAKAEGDSGDSDRSRRGRPVGNTFRRRGESDANAAAVVGKASVHNGRGTGLRELPYSGRDRARVLGIIICGVYREQLRSAQSLGDGRYLLVRYEDIAASAERSVERVYGWTGLGKVPARVSIWIMENTRLQDCADDADSKYANAKDTENYEKGSSVERRQDVTAVEDSSHRSSSKPDAATKSTPEKLHVGTGVPMPSKRHGTERTQPEASNHVLAERSDAAADHRRRLKSNTINKDSQSVKCRAQNAERAAWDKYGTRRHAAAMAGLWRTQMPEAEASVVWEACGASGVMDEFGYTRD